MAALSFDAELDRVEGLLAVSRPDIDALAEAMSALNGAYPAEMSGHQIERIFAISDRVAGRDGSAPIAVPDANAGRFLSRQADRVITRLFEDEGRRNRGFAASTVRRARAFNEPPPAGAPTSEVPHVHRAITRARASELAAPFFASLEPALEEDPLSHISWCWRALEDCVLPFAWVLEGWLDDLDRRGLAGGRNREVLERARALHALSEAGQQKLRWPNCQRILLPQLHDPHVLIAAHAAKFLGTLYSDPAYFFPGGQDPAPLPEILRGIADLPMHRRAVAGAFLDGLQDAGSPFAALGDLDEADIKDWVLKVFSDDGPEPYLPGVQAFWFYVHERFCADPDFIMRLIDAGHAWEAMMCATEIYDERVEGMKPVLERLAALDDPEVAAPAQGLLDGVYRRPFAPEDGA